MELLSLVFVLFAAQLIHGNERNKTSSEWEEPQELKTKYPYYISGYTAEGAPVWIVEFGKWDIRGAAEKGGEYSNSFQKYIRLAIKRWKNSSMIGGNNGTFVMICDGEGWSFRQMSHFGTIRLLVDTIRHFTEKLSGTSFKVVGVNVNVIAYGIWRLARPILGTLRNNVEIYGSNPSVWRPHLLRLVPKDQLPEYYGGSKLHKVIQYFG